MYRQIVDTFIQYEKVVSGDDKCRAYMLTEYIYRVDRIFKNTSKHVPDVTSMLYGEHIGPSDNIIRLYAKDDRIVCRND